MIEITPAAREALAAVRDGKTPDDIQQLAAIARAGLVQTTPVGDFVLSSSGRKALAVTRPAR